MKLRRRDEKATIARRLHEKDREFVESLHLSWMTEADRQFLADLDTSWPPKPETVTQTELRIPLPDGFVPDAPAPAFRDQRHGLNWGVVLVLALFVAEVAAVVWAVDWVAKR